MLLTLKYRCQQPSATIAVFLSMSAIVSIEIVMLLPPPSIEVISVPAANSTPDISIPTSNPATLAILIVAAPDLVFLFSVSFETEHDAVSVGKEYAAVVVAAEEDPATAPYCFVVTFDPAEVAFAFVTAWASGTLVGAKDIAPTKTPTRMRWVVFM